MRLTLFSTSQWHEADPDITLKYMTNYTDQLFIHSYNSMFCTHTSNTGTEKIENRDLGVTLSHPLSIAAHSAAAARSCRTPRGRWFLIHQAWTKATQALVQALVLSLSLHLHFRPLADPCNQLLNLMTLMCLHDSGCILFAFSWFNELCFGQKLLQNKHNGM